MLIKNCSVLLETTDYNGGFYLTLFSDGVNLEGMNHTRQNIELLKLLTAISLEIQQLQQTTESRLSRLESILAKMNGNNKSAGDLGLNDSEHSKVSHFSRLLLSYEFFLIKCLVF